MRSGKSDAIQYLSLFLASGGHIRAIALASKDLAITYFEVSIASF